MTEQEARDKVRRLTDDIGRGTRPSWDGFGEEEEEA